MLDINFITKHPDIVKDAITAKNIRSVTIDDIDTLITLHQSSVALLQEIQNLRTRRNEIADTIPTETDSTKKQHLIAEGKQIKDEVQTREQELNSIEKKKYAIMQFIPNIPSADTPRGTDDSGNIVLRTVGKKPEFNFTPRDHVDILDDLGLAEFERGNKVSGFRGYFLKGDIALLQWAILTYAVQKMAAKGYSVVIPPILVKKFSVFGTGHMPWGGADVYQVESADVDVAGKEQDKTLLAGTAEIPLMAMYANETFQEEKLPLKMVGFSPCYRREIGSYSKDVHGLFRVHEFMKLEQVVICPPDADLAAQLLEEIMANSEELLKDLGLHYQVLAMCTGDMGEPQHKKYDIETWMPGRNKFGETHSASNMTDFQCRRNNIKVQTKSGERVVAYSLNNTVIALPRFLVAIIENYQQEDGSIAIPTVLQAFMGKKVINKAE